MSDMIRKTVVLTIFCAFLSGCANVVRPNYTQTLQELRSGAYTLDPEHAYLIFRVEHLGLSTIVGRFNMIDATLDFDPAVLTDLSLDGIVDVSSIDLNSSSLENRLRGTQWLDAQSFPQARFVSDSVEPLAGNSFMVNGQFTLRGVTLPMSLEATFKGGADNLLTGKYTLGFSATTSLNRSDFGIDGFAALVADEISVEIHGEFQRSDEPS